ncbi:hypothetical protein GA0115236_130513 [Streptomyces sp. IgraMP-1]|nr:hypothetical protein GA0115236_130513 [Streptomyces sp. IgraMP-1]
MVLLPERAWARRDTSFSTERSMRSSMTWAFCGTSDRSAIP